MLNIMNIYPLGFVFNNFKLLFFEAKRQQLMANRLT